MGQEALKGGWGCFLFIFALGALAIAMAGGGDPNTDLLKIVWVVMGAN